MRTGRSLTVCYSLLPGEGGLPGLGGSALGGVCSGGVHLVRGVLPARGGAVRRHPPVNRITHTCKNITLATTSLRPVKILQCEEISNLINDRGTTMGNACKDFGLNDHPLQRAGISLRKSFSNVKMSLSLHQAIYSTLQACVKNSVHGGVYPNMHWGRHPLPLGKTAPPPRSDSPTTATAADGTRPTGMHSCFIRCKRTQCVPIRTGL